MGNFLKKIDLFEIPISFRYKKEDGFSTVIGGIFTLAIIIWFIIILIYDFIPFIKKENFTFFFNIINIPYTEEIKLNGSFAIGFGCDNDQNGRKLEKYLDLEVKYYNKKINENGIYDKNDPKNEPHNITYNACNYIDFYREYNDSDNNNINKELKCLNELNKNIKGYYGDTTFQYYEISLLAKENISFKEIDELLLNEDYKLELYYIDNQVNYSDYENPIKPFINKIFLQLNPEFHVKMNTFFIKQYLYNDNNVWHFAFTSGTEEKVNNLFSRTEQYFLYKGLNREEKKPSKYKYYATIYIRADTKKIEVKRKYQNLDEFWANTFSFLEIVLGWFSFFYKSLFREYLNYLIAHKLFFFKEKENKHFNIYDQNNKTKIEKLIDLTDISSKDNKNNTNTNTNTNPNLSNQNISHVPIGSNKPLTKNNTLTIVIKRKFSYLFKFISQYDNFVRISISKAYNIMNTNLDVIYYIKNMIFLEKYREWKYNDKKEIFKFLCTPIIYANDEENKNNRYNKDDYYKKIKPYSNEDFDKFDGEISELVKSVKESSISKKKDKTLNNKNDDESLKSLITKDDDKKINDKAEKLSLSNDDIKLINMVNHELKKLNE